jgi:Ran GTPase-activating protein (RanGAP) involved in mRNA processing and transport
MALNSNGKLGAIQLDLSSNDIGPEGATTVAKALMISHNLHTLKLKTCKLGNEGVQILCKAMEENKSTKVFDISFNMKSGKTHDVLKALSELVTKGTPLEKLLISGNERLFLGKEITGLFAALKSSKVTKSWTKLKILD